MKCDLCGDRDGGPWGLHYLEKSSGFDGPIVGAGFIPGARRAAARYTPPAPARTSLMLCERCEDALRWLNLVQADTLSTASIEQAIFYLRAKNEPANEHFTWLLHVRKLFPNVEHLVLVDDDGRPKLPVQRTKKGR